MPDKIYYPSPSMIAALRTVAAIVILLPQFLKARAAIATDPPVTDKQLWKPLDNMTTTAMRSSSSCHWGQWSNAFWTGLTEVKERVNVSYRRCALLCCANKQCATFDYRKAWRTCYMYNENMNDELSYSKEEASGWQMGVLTYKNGLQITEPSIYTYP